MTRSPALISALPAHLPIAVQRHAACGPAARARREVVHDHAGISLYLSGTTRLWMELDYTLVRGDLLLIPEGMPHGASGPGDGELLGIMLCTSCMRGAWGEHLRVAFDDVRRGELAVRRLSEDALAEVVRIVAALDEELARRGPHHDLMVDGLMSQLTACIARAAPARVSEVDPGRPRVVADALAYIEKNATRAISLKDVSRAVARSPAHLAALMKRHTGRTAVEWITHARMALARQLLLSSDEGIEAIAAHVGFASASHFHRTFRRLHQLSPGDWREAHRSS